MIIIKNREMLIPDSEQHLGTTYDAETEVRQFKIPRVNAGIDLSDLTFNLDIKYPDATLDTALLTKNVTDTAIILTWDITNRQLAQEGTLFVQMRAYDENVTAKWSTLKAPFYVDGHFQIPKHYDGDLSELEQLEAEIAGFKNAETIRVNNELTRISNEELRVSAEADRVAAETARENAETARAAAFTAAQAERAADYTAAETAREAQFDSAIAGFNRDRADLSEIRDEAEQAATDAERYAGICEAYADIVMPIFEVLFTDGEVHYNDTCSFDFTINQTTGNLDYILVQS